MTESSNSFAPRRSIRPYMALIVILMGVMALQSVVSAKTHSWEPLISTSVIWIFFAILVFIGTRYRVFLQDGKIIQKAYGKPEVAITFDDITSISDETSSVSTLIRLQTPFRRIEVRGKGKAVIDISLKHFVTKDVDRLLDELRTHRPDLASEGVSLPG